MSAIAGKITWVLRGLVLFTFLGVIVPLALLPITTSVPTCIVLGVVAGIVALAIAAVMASQVFASTLAITYTKGRLLPKSIVVLEQVTLNGSKQWITIRSKNRSNAVLLYLAVQVAVSSR